LVGKNPAGRMSARGARLPIFSGQGSAYGRNATATTPHGKAPAFMVRQFDKLTVLSEAEGQAHHKPSWGLP